ncbi:hypothetical protein GGI13_002029 [Coemansia sp. RSA 455]|nr:hypothetical protein GGI13_002029 [Coemansia sp. RSA 455]
MEDRLSKAESEDNKENRGATPMTKPMRHSRYNVNSSRLEACFKDIKKWTRTEVAYAGWENNMYSAVKSFIAYVAHFVKGGIQSSNLSAEARQGWRLLLPGKDVDVNPEDSDDSMRIDIGLIASKHDAAIELCVKPSYYHLRAVVEAKKGKAEGDLRDAFAQLCEYMQQKYAEHYN